MAENLYQDLKDLLQEFKDFLDPKVAVIKPAVQALAALIPQINDLINQLITILQQVKTTVQNLNVSAIPNLSDVTDFTGHIQAFLTEAKKLVPAQASVIDEALNTVAVVGSLPSIDQVRTAITTLIDQLIADLSQLKSA
jgi:phage-related protein